MAKKHYVCSLSKMDTVFHDLIRHFRSVHAKGKPTLSMSEFDLRIRRIRIFDPKHPTLDVLPWGWRVTPNVEHLYGHIADIPDNYTKIADLPESVWDSTWLITPKLIGISVIVYYRHGLLRRCVTQGDGEHGWDVTNNVISRIPIVIYPHDDRKARFTGYIRCVATVNQNQFFRKFPKTVPLKETIHNLLTIESDIPKDSSYLSIIPVNIYNAPYNQYVRAGSLGWRVYTKGFYSSTVHRRVKINADPELQTTYLTEEAAGSLSGPFPYSGLVVRAYDKDEENLRHIFTFKLKGKANAVPAVVSRIEWYTTGSGKIRPNIIVISDVFDNMCPEVSATSHQFIAANKIGRGAKLLLTRKKGGQTVINKVIKPSEVCKPDVSCQYGCDVEFIDIDGAHAYCRNPKCPATLLTLFKNTFDLFAPKYFYAPVRRIVMRYFRNDVFEMWDYYKNMREISVATVLIDGLSAIGKQKYCEFLSAMLRWELNLHQLVYLCGIERLCKLQSDFIAKKASSSAELTEWADNASILTEDWGITPKARKNWERRHYLVKKVLKYFKIIPARSVLIL